MSCPNVLNQEYSRLLFKAILHIDDISENDYKYDRKAVITEPSRHEKYVSTIHSKLQKQV